MSQKGSICRPTNISTVTYERDQLLHIRDTMSCEYAMKLVIQNAFPVDNTPVTRTPKLAPRFVAHASEASGVAHYVDSAVVAYDQHYQPLF